MVAVEIAQSDSASKRSPVRSKTSSSPLSTPAGSSSVKTTTKTLQLPSANAGSNANAAVPLSAAVSSVAAAETAPNDQKCSSLQQETRAKLVLKRPSSAQMKPSSSSATANQEVGTTDVKSSKPRPQSAGPSADRKVTANASANASAAAQRPTTPSSSHRRSLSEQRKDLSQKMEVGPKPQQKQQPKQQSVQGDRLRPRIPSANPRVRT